MTAAVLHSQYQAYNPFRTTDWRHKRVIDLYNRRPHGRPSRRGDDRYVHAYYRFYPRWQRAGTEQQRQRLFSSHPGLFFAAAFHSHPDVEWRKILEARILAGTSDEEIAREYSTLPAAIDWYEKLFFNVRDRLESHDWIVKTILGAPASREGAGDGGVTHNQRYIFLQTFAYFGGPLALDIAMCGMRRSPLPRDNRQLNTWLDDAIKTTMRQKGALTAQGFHINRWTVMPLLEMTCRLMEMDKEEQNKTNPYEEAVAGFLARAGMVIGEKQTAEQRSELFVRFERTNIEPRAEDQYALQDGQVPASLAKHLDFKPLEITHDRSGHTD